MPEAAAPESSARRDGDRDAAHDLRMRIRELIRDTRTARHMSQSTLGDLVSVSRFTIMRYERGELNVPLRVAERLDKALELSELSALVRKLDGLGGATEKNERDLVVQRLLQDTPGLESVAIASTDDLDILDLLYDVVQNRPRLNARDVRVVFPTVDRERQLFHGQPLYAHIERQIKRLVDLQASEFRPFTSLQIFESDEILASCVIVNTRTSTECAYWSPLPIDGKVDGGTLPITSSVDPYTTGRLEEYVNRLVTGRDPLRTNEALCRVDTGKGKGTGQSRFTRYFALGTDEEEDVAEDEGFAIALVLVMALCPRLNYGLARRIVTYRRPSARQDRERLSLFSNNVDDGDIRMARSIEAGSTAQSARSTRGALAAALDINTYLSGHDGVVPDLAFQLAATRELAMFGLSIDIDRLRPIRLPPHLQLIRKTNAVGRRRASLAPRVFTLELDPSADAPELDILEAAADIEVVGIDDLMESTQLNSFLEQARESDVLDSMLDELGLARR